MNFVLKELALERALCERKDVVFIGFDVEQPDDILSRNCGHEALTSPDCVQILWVSGDSELDFAVRNELLCKVQFELDKQEMGRDDDHTVLLFVEQDALYASWHFTDLRAVLKVIGEAYRAAGAAKEEEGVDIVNIWVLVDHQGAEDDL